MLMSLSVFFVFFNDTATTEIYTLSLHDALPISANTRPAIISTVAKRPKRMRSSRSRDARVASGNWRSSAERSEEHTSELQSRQYLVCRLLLEKKTHTPQLLYIQ